MDIRPIARGKVQKNCNFASFFAKNFHFNFRTVNFLHYFAKNESPKLKSFVFAPFSAHIHQTSDVYLFISQPISQGQISCHSLPRRTCALYADAFSHIPFYISKKNRPLSESGFRSVFFLLIRRRHLLHRHHHRRLRPLHPPRHQGPALRASFCDAR